MTVFVLAVLFISSFNVLSGYFYEFNSSTHCLNFGEILYTVGGGGGTAIYEQYRCVLV